MEPSREPFRNTQNRSIPLSFLPSNRSTLNLNSRPFTLNHRLLNAPNRLPSLNLPPINHQPARLIDIHSINVTEDVSAPRKPDVKCHYCSAEFASELIAEHTESCELRKISCDRCGERVLMEIFDFHFEECDPQAPLDYGNPMRMQNGDEMDDESMDNEEIEVNDRMFQQEERMTYELLLRLDETIVKKGMSPEQLKDFPVQLYVKSLDGEGSCNICLYEYETGEYVRKLSCCHKFHKDCIDKWLDTSITCPMCKKYLR